MTNKPNDGGMEMRLLRPTEVAQRVGLSRATLWRLEHAGEFPSRRQIGPNSVGWLEHEIEEWIESRPYAREESSCFPAEG